MDGMIDWTTYQVSVIELEYFRQFPDFYAEIIKWHTVSPKLKAFLLKRREILKNNKKVDTIFYDLELAAKLAGVGRGMEWLGAYGGTWAGLILKARLRNQRELTANEEALVRAKVWEQFVRFATYRSGRPNVATLNAESAIYARYLLGPLPWPRDPIVGAFSMLPYVVPED